MAALKGNRISPVVNQTRARFIARKLELLRELQTDGLQPSEDAAALARAATRAERWVPGDDSVRINLTNIIQIK